jgi:hypothetical protein
MTMILVNLSLKICKSLRLRITWLLHCQDFFKTTLWTNYLLKESSILYSIVFSFCHFICPFSLNFTLLYKHSKNLKKNYDFLFRIILILNFSHEFSHLTHKLLFFIAIKIFRQFIKFWNRNNNFKPIIFVTFYCFNKFNISSVSYNLIIFIFKLNKKVSKKYWNVFKIINLFNMYLFLMHKTY